MDRHAGSSTVRTLIADDHPVVRAGIEAMLSAAPDIAVVGSVGSADAAIAAAKDPSVGVDVVLMDLRFGESPNSGESDGVRATRSLRSLPSPPEVLILTNYSTDGDVVGAVSAGAVGYLLKDCGPEELASAIRTAARGQTVMNQQVMGKLVGRMNQPFQSLTQRELDVLRLAGQGRSNRMIAAELVLTEATVKSHMAHIFSKLDVKNRTAAVAVARERGII